MTGWPNPSSGTPRRRCTGSPCRSSGELRCAANLDVFEQESVLDPVRAHEPELERLEIDLRDIPIVGDVRGAGYFWAIELVLTRTRWRRSRKTSERLLRGYLAPRFYEAGLICRTDDRGHPIVQLAPPLVAGPDEFDFIEATRCAPCSPDVEGRMALLVSQSRCADYPFCRIVILPPLSSRAGSGRLKVVLFPRFDSPSVFGRILDEQAGHWSIHPTADAEVTRRYV